MSAREGIDVEELFAAHRDGVLVFLVRRAGDTEVALDLWAETFAQAVLGQKRFRGSSPEEAAGWLFGIARRQLAAYHRRGYAERRAMDRLKLERAPASPGVLEELERRAGLGELRAELTAALATLSPLVRDAVELRVVGELDYPSLAARLGTSEPAARARVSRGLSSLADLIDRHSHLEAASS